METVATYLRLGPKAPLLLAGSLQVLVLLSTLFISVGCSMPLITTE